MIWGMFLTSYRSSSFVYPLSAISKCLFQDKTIKASLVGPAALQAANRKTPK